jgi:bifunctional non-homologous end joining protein LigD
MKEPVRPMLATLVAEPFLSAGWVNEEKYDGIRALAYCHRRGARLYTRNLRDVSAEFPEICRALQGLSEEKLVLDGELVAFDRQGVSCFQLLQRRATGEKIRPVFAVFDCLERDGMDLVHRPLSERRKAVEAIVPRRGELLMWSRRLSPNGLVAYRMAQAKGWEGIIAKDDASPYEIGKRSRSWLKVKCRKESEFVIGGYSAPAGSRVHFGALLVGLFDRGKLRFVGKVGTGFTTSVLADLMAAMRGLRTDRPAFSPPPAARGVTWVRPRLVAQIAFAEWTSDGMLRQPAFLGLRKDKKPSECTWRSRET